MRKVLVIVGMLLAFCCTSRADDIYAQYQVSGLLTIVGNNACQPLPACAETLDFSFSAYEEFETSMSVYELFIVPGSGVTESLGPLGTFSGPTGGHLGTPEPGDSCVDCNFAGFVDTGGDEIDIHFSQGIGDSPFTPSIVSALLYGCGTQTCITDLSPFGPGTTIGIFLDGEVTATVTQVTEISSASLLAAGLLALLGLGIARRRAKAPVPPQS
jgi:hypothetical protein